MTQEYCDIVPQANGWCFLSEEGQSPVYPTYRLAVEAAQLFSDKQVSLRKVTVLRQQDLKGRMQEIGGMTQSWGPGAASFGSRA
jgi:hypothetical protein